MQTYDYIYFCILPFLFNTDMVKCKYIIVGLHFTMSVLKRKVWRYQSRNQKPLFEEWQTPQWPYEKGTKRQTTIYKTLHRKLYFFFFFLHHGKGTVLSLITCFTQTWFYLFFKTNCLPLLKEEWIIRDDSKNIGMMRIVVSNSYCVVFLVCFSSSCVPYCANFSGLSILDCPSRIL
jgi:hypothetical protein